MKEKKSEKQIKTVEPKKGWFAAEEKSEEISKAPLIAKKSIKVSKPKETWSVNAGDDVSSLPPEKLAILKNNGVI